MGEPLFESSKEITKWLLNNGFDKYGGHESQFTLIKRIHELHYLFWSENINHFFLAVINEGGKREAAGIYNKWKTIIIPVSIRTIKDAKSIISALNKSE